MTETIRYQISEISDQEAWNPRAGRASGAFAFCDPGRGCAVEIAWSYGAVLRDIWDFAGAVEVLRCANYASLRMTDWRTTKGGKEPV